MYPARAEPVNVTAAYGLRRDVEGGDLALLVGVRPELHVDGPARDQVARLDNVSGGPDAGHGRPHAPVNAQRPRCADLAPGGDRHLDVGLATHCEHDSVSLVAAGIGHHLAAPAIVGAQLHQFLPQVELNAVVGQDILEPAGHVLVEAAHDVAATVDQMDAQPAVDQRLGNLQADVSGADDRHGAHLGVRIEQPSQAFTLVEGVHHESVLGETRQVGNPGVRARRVQQRVVRLGPVRTGGEVAHGHPPVARVDRDRLGFGVHRDALRMERVRRTHDEILCLVDQPADVVRDAAHRVGRIRATFDDGDLRVVAQTADGGRDGHSRRVTTDDQQAHQRPSGSPMRCT
jgi:hypothetical protein